MLTTATQWWLTVADFFKNYQKIKKHILLLKMQKKMSVDIEVNGNEGKTHQQTILMHLVIIPDKKDFA